VYDDVNLRHGERLLWSGRPQRYPFFVRQDILGVPFSLVWLGFVSFWLYSVWVMDGPGLFKIWGIPFVLFGIFQAFVRPVVRWMQLRATRYAVTSLRVIEIVDRPWSKRTEHYLRDLPPPIHRGEGMVGSVAFGEFPGFYEAAFGTARRGEAKQRLVLREIPQPRNLRDIIASAQTQKA